MNPEFVANYTPFDWDVWGFVLSMLGATTIVLAVFLRRRRIAEYKSDLQRARKRAIKQKSNVAKLAKIKNQDEYEKRWSKLISLGEELIHKPM